ADRLIVGACAARARREIMRARAAQDTSAGGRSTGALCGYLAFSRADECCRSRRRRVWAHPHRLHRSGFRETEDCRAILDEFRELRADTLRRASVSPADRSGPCRALAGYVATEPFLDSRLGHCR